MQDLIVSLNGNVVKVAHLKNGEFSSVVKDVPKEVADDSRILDSSGFATILQEAITEISPDKKTKFRLNFVAEPEDTNFKFITVNKGTEDLESKILAEIQSKLEGEDLTNLYFSYIKIAPFVYQFVSVKKEFLEKFIEVSANLGVELHSVLPWVLLLPKYVGSNASSIFVCGIGKAPVVVLSELGGVFFVGSYNENEDPAVLYKLVQELSVYKRAKPIDKVYTFNYPHLKEAEGFSVHAVEIPNSGTEQTVGFEVNLLANYMLDLVPDTLFSQTNLLNLLPLPVVEKKQFSLTKVGVPVGAVLLAVLLFGGFMFFAQNKGSQKNPQGQVLSNGNVVESSQSTQTQPPAQNENQTQPQLDRKDLVVRVENGSGVNGMAAQTKEVLEGLGYKVLSIDTASETRETTLFKFKTAKLGYKDIVLTDLKDKFPNTVVEDGIETENEYDLLLIVGTSQTL